MLKIFIKETRFLNRFLVGEAQPFERKQGGVQKRAKGQR